MPVWYTSNLNSIAEYYKFTPLIPEDNLTERQYRLKLASELREKNVLIEAAEVFTVERRNDTMINNNPAVNTLCC